MPPNGTDMRQIAGAGRNRRHLGDLIGTAPGQDVRAMVNRRMRQPAFGAGHEPALGFCAQQPRSLADDRAFIRAWKGQVGLGQFAIGRMVAHRRQQWPCGNLAGGNQLFDLEDLDCLIGVIGFGVSDNGMRGAKVNADQIVCCGIFHDDIFSLFGRTTNPKLKPAIFL